MQVSKDGLAEFLMQRLQHHVREYTLGPGCHAKVDTVIKGLNLTAWPSGWNATAGELAAVIGVLKDTLLDTCEELGLVKAGT